MEITQILRKRWALATAFLILTIIATATALVKLPWTYTSTSDILYLPSSNLAKAYGGNPYLAFSPTINELADAIRYEATDAATAQTLAAAGYTQGYSITDALDTSAPILLITVTGSSAGAVEHTLTGVVSEISTLLASRQSDYRSVDRVHDSVIASNPEAKRVTGKKARPLLVVFGIGLLFTVAVPILVDAVAERARRQRNPAYRTRPRG
jgi:capsular polysaccharide biosynthesis protein